MEWMNYHHLFYFWTVVRAGTISKASEQSYLFPGDQCTTGEP